jgi:hypothetical protein
MALPFPSQYSKLVVANAALDTHLALDCAVAQSSHPNASLSRLAISVVQPDPKQAGLYRHGGIRAGDVYFGASLLKIAAMYGAYELRKSCRAVSRASRAATPALLFRELRTRFDAPIRASVPALRDVSPAIRLPKYPTLFKATRLTGGGWQLDFTKAVATNIRKMIVESSNSDAAACIRALGYCWINGALRAGGFFRATDRSGIWLAGAFSRGSPYVRIPTANRGSSAQAMTTIDMANLYAHLLNQSLVGAADSAEMLGLLRDAQAYEPSWLTPRARPVQTRSFTPTHTKIGLGPATKAGSVYSEGTLATYSGRRTAIVVFSNALGNSLDAISEVVDLFLKRP